MIEHPLSTRTLPFFVATYAITWLLQLPAVLALRGVIAGPVERYMLLVGLGAFGPLLAAVIMSLAKAGGPGVRSLFRPLAHWRAGGGWYLVALFAPGATFAAGMALYSLLGVAEAGPWFYPPTNTQRIVAMIVFPIGEEIGWRGFALPRLQQRYGALNASLILGVVWALWHIPMFMLAGVPLSLLGVMILFFVPGSVFFTWIYNRTGAGLALALAAHVGAHLSNSHQALPGNTVPLFVHTAAYAVLALGLLLADREAWRKRELSKP